MAGRRVTCTTALAHCILGGLGPGSQHPFPSLAGRGGQILPGSRSSALASSRRRDPQEGNLLRCPPSLGARMPARTSGSPSPKFTWLFQPCLCHREERSVSRTEGKWLCFTVVALGTHLCGNGADVLSSTC